MTGDKTGGGTKGGTSVHKVVFLSKSPSNDGEDRPMVVSSFKADGGGVVSPKESMVNLFKSQNSPVP